MFGYIRPDASELKVKQEQLYRAVYCGLCKTQRRRTGFFSCMTLSYDFVFLYLFLAELRQIDTELKRRRPSLFHPDRHEYAVENGLLRYCAGCAALLNFHKMQDVARDESFFKSLLARLALPYFHYSLKKARRIVDLPEKESSFCMQELLKMEKEGGYSPDEMARCSGELLSVICAYGIDDELLRCAAQRFGQTVGSWLYLVDAADDYEDDLKHRRFNPFVNGIEKEEHLSTDFIDAQKLLNVGARNYYDGWFADKSDLTVSSKGDIQVRDSVRMTNYSNAEMTAGGGIIFARIE